MSRLWSRNAKKLSKIWVPTFARKGGQQVRPYENAMDRRMG